MHNPNRKLRSCDAPGCEILNYYAKGLCRMHYDLDRRPRIVRTPRPTAVCQRCGITYTVGYNVRGVYCSMACNRNRVKKTCLSCNTVFEVTVSKVAKYTYCSLTCRPIRVIPRTCEHCGKAFTRSRTQGPGRFCSRSCLWQSGRITYICAYCGKSCTTKKNRMAPSRRCCSNRCATLLRMEKGFEPGYMATKRREHRRTDIEALAEAVLLDLGIPYEFEKKIGRWSADFAIPGLARIIECDGWQHTKTKGKDAHRDADLLSRGWRVTRIPDKALRTNARRAVMIALLR
jgi:very-short-patch-repair endonuclease